MSVRDLRPVRVRGVGRDAGRVVLSIDVDGVHGEAGPPLKVVMTADEERLTAQFLREAAGRRFECPPVPSVPILRPADEAADVDDAPALSRERWDRWLGGHVWSLFGFRSAGGAADPRAPP